MSTTTQLFDMMLIIPSAYDDVMKIMTIAATAVGIIPLILAFSVPNWYLGDQQNAGNNTDLAGESTGEVPKN